MGSTCAEYLARYECDARLVAIAAGSRPPGLAARYGVEVEPDVRTLVRRSDVEAVIVTSPQSAHREQALLAAGGGKHVMLETRSRSGWPRATT